MSATAPPISPFQFSLAIRDLPLENLYAKAAEINNSIAHLERSNASLREYSDSIRNDGNLSGETREEVGDRECMEAVRENEIVIERQRERVGLLRGEVERRGRVWHESGEGEVNGEDAGEVGRGGSGGAGGRGGRLTDEELRRQMEERMAGDEEEGGGGEGGMHL